MIGSRFLLFFVFIGIGWSCGPRHDMLIPEEEMSQILMDITIADEVLKLYPPAQRDSMRTVLTESLLKIHKLDRSELDTNLYLYTSDFGLWGKSIDRVTEKTNVLEKKPQEQ